MSLFKASTEAFLKPIKMVAGIVETKNTMPILSNVLIRQEGDRIVLVANDANLQVTTHLNVRPEVELPPVTVSAHKLLSVLNALPSGALLDVSKDDSKLTLRCVGTRFALQTLPGEDFPVLPTTSPWVHHFSMPQKMLHELLSMIHYCMATQDIRFYLNGIYMLLETGLVHAVATDGHRLAHMAFAINTTVEPNAEGVASVGAIIHRKTVDQLLRLLDHNSEEPVHVSLSKTQGRFVFGDVEVVAKLTEGQYPNYNSIIPRDYDLRLLVNSADFNESLKRAVVLVSEDKMRSVRLHFGNNQLRVSSSNMEQEEARMELPIAYTGPEFDVGFNASYLLDMLKMTKSEHVVISTKPEGDASVLITLPDNPHFCYVVMPLRI